MKAKSIAVLQAAVLILQMVMMPGHLAYGESHDTRSEDAISRPGKPPTAAVEAYNFLLQQVANGEEIKLKNDVLGEENATLAKDKLNGPFSKWLTAIENMHSRAEECRDHRGAKQLSDLLTKWVNTVAGDLSAATKVGADGKPAGDRVKVKDLELLEVAIHQVADAQAKEAGDKKSAVEEQNKALFTNLEKTKLFIAGAEQSKINEKFKADTAKLDTVIKPGAKFGAADAKDTRKLSEIVAQAKESIAKKTGAVCEINPKKEKSDADAEEGDALAEKSGGKKKVDAKTAQFTQEPGNKTPAANGGVQPGGQVPQAGAQPVVEVKGGGTFETPDPKPAFADITGSLGFNGGLGDILEQQREAQNDNLKLATALAGQQGPSVNTRSVGPTPVAPVSPLPPIGLGGLGGFGGGLGGYGGGGYPPPMPPMMPMPPPMPMPMPPPVPIKKEETTVTEERVDPIGPMPQIQLPPPMPQQPPTVVNEINIMIRYPNGQIVSWPANQPIPAGATLVTSNNPYGNSGLGTNGLVTTPTGLGSNTNVSGILGLVSSVNTGNRMGVSNVGSSNSTVGGSVSNVNAVNPNGGRGRLSN